MDIKNDILLSHKPRDYQKPLGLTIWVFLLFTISITLCAPLLLHATISTLKQMWEKFEIWLFFDFSYYLLYYAIVFLSLKASICFVQRNIEALRYAKYTLITTAFMPAVLVTIGLSMDFSELILVFTLAINCLFIVSCLLFLAGKEQAGIMVLLLLLIGLALISTSLPAMLDIIYISNSHVSILACLFLHRILRSKHIQSILED